MYREPFFVMKTSDGGPSKGSYRAVLRLIQAPNDFLLLSMEEIKSNWQVKDLTIVVVH